LKYQQYNAKLPAPPKPEEQEPVYSKTAINSSINSSINFGTSLNDSTDDQSQPLMGEPPKKKKKKVKRVKKETVDD